MLPLTIIYIVCFIKFYNVPHIPWNLYYVYIPVSPAPCTDTEWTCVNRKCVRQESLCDGVDQCGDGSDESYAHARCGGETLYFYNIDSINM